VKSEMVCPQYESQPDVTAYMTKLLLAKINIAEINCREMKRKAEKRKLKKTMAESY